MRFSRCQRVLTRVALAALALCAIVPEAMAAKPSKPGRPGGFRLLSSALNIFQANRVQCYVVSDGTICYTGSSTVPGGAWPRGTANSYVFGSGINIAGVIEPGDRSINGFAGDTAGGFFNNTAGGNNGLPIRPIFDSNDPDDAADWPEEARVPLGDATAELFDPTLQGQLAASQGDLWFVAWEGDPGNLASRTHPLGVLVETRAMAWNFPAGNEDIIYFIYTFYNITSLNPDSYLGARPEIRPLLLEQAQRFHALNTAKYGINLPEDGYTITDMFAAFTADMDVANANLNFAGVNVPFALGYTYDASFSGEAAASIGWTFDPAIFGLAPFFPGPGFIGVKYLGSPTNPETGAPVGLTLFGTFSRSSGSLQDPSDDKQLYRYITGGLSATDGACSLPNPIESKICFVNISSPADMRFFQSSGPIDLPAGGFGSITAAYVFAAPVASGACPGASCLVAPANNNADLTILGDPVRMASGVNTIDTMMGYLGNTNGNATDTNTAIVTQEEFVTVPGSLLGKARVAQSVFDNKFLLPFAPDRPEFFLVPGNGQVTVLWQRSATETNGDPFFAVASSPTTEGSPNPLYDPNFRQRDVEGYRVYRGRTDSPSELTLLAQFDYAPDAEGRGIFTDFRGIVNPIPTCAPELATAPTDPVVAGCATTFSTPLPGEPYVGSVDIDLVGTITQLTPGNRVLLASGEAQSLPGVVDTAFKEITAGRLASGASTVLANTGVPFIFVDRGVRNSLRYFYSVTAFDVNSLVSGPSSLESARLSKAVTPTPAASNTASSSEITTGIFGRDVELPEGTTPTIDPATGRFSGPFPPANGASLEFVGDFAAQLFSEGGSVKVRLDGVGMGDQRNAIPAKYTFTAFSNADTVTFSLDLDPGFADATVEINSPPFPAALADPALAANFGATGSTVLSGSVAFNMLNYQQTVAQVRGCAEEGIVVPVGDATGCSYNGPRWFAGDNETADHPNAGMSTDFSGVLLPGTNLNNAGELPGVVTIFTPMTHGNMTDAWRGMDASLGGVVRAADLRVYWGNPGKIDSVMDLTHNVPVPFMADSMGAGFGVLNVSGSSGAGSSDARPTVLTINDLSCVEPWRTGAAGTGARTLWGTAPTCAAPYVFSDSAEQNSIAIFSGAPSLATTAPVSANAGFLLYIAGRIFMFELEGGALPTQTAWTMRGYTGWVSGGEGAGGSLGPYAFTESEVRPFTALGTELQLNFEVTNVVNAAEDSDLTAVHTVPDPYYVLSAFEASTEQKVLKFVGLPQKAIIRIYSASGVLVRLLEHDGAAYSPTSLSQGSEMVWDLRNRNNQVVASGVYFFHVEAGDARRVGRFTVVNFAQ